MANVSKKILITAIFIFLVVFGFTFGGTQLVYAGETGGAPAGGAPVGSAPAGDAPVGGGVGPSSPSQAKPVPPSTASKLPPGLVIGLRHTMNQTQDRFVLPQISVKFERRDAPDRSAEESPLGSKKFAEGGWYYWMIPLDSRANPQDWKLPPGLVIGLNHYYAKDPSFRKIIVFGYDPFFGPEYLPGGFFKKEFGGDIGAEARGGFYWYESTGQGFNDWNMVNQLPRGTILCLKHTRNQKNKKLAWQGMILDPADSHIQPPQGFARKFGGDRGMKSGQGYYWYEKITGK